MKKIGLLFSLMSCLLLGSYSHAADDRIQDNRIQDAGNQNYQQFDHNDQNFNRQSYGSYDNNSASFNEPYHQEYSASYHHGDSQYYGQGNLSQPVFNQPNFGGQHYDHQAYSCGAGMNCAAPSQSFGGNFGGNIVSSNSEGGDYQEFAVGKPMDHPCGECYCLYCRYCPRYYYTKHCDYVPQYSYQRCCKYVPQYYCQTKCRYVPQYYQETCCRQVPQYYYVCNCKYCPKYRCEKHCQYVPQYYYKKVNCGSNGCGPCGQ